MPPTKHTGVVWNPGFASFVLWQAYGGEECPASVESKPCSPEEICILHAMWRSTEAFLSRAPLKFSLQFERPGLQGFHKLRACGQAIS